MKRLTNLLVALILGATFLYSTIHIQEFMNIVIVPLQLFCFALWATSLIATIFSGYLICEALHTGNGLIWHRLTPEEALEHHTEEVTEIEGCRYEKICDGLVRERYPVTIWIHTDDERLASGRMVAFDKNGAYNYRLY